MYLLRDGAAVLREPAEKLENELDQFSPPKLRSKSRFMNLGPLFVWATMVLYHLDHPARGAICPVRYVVGHFG